MEDLKAPQLAEAAVKSIETSGRTAYALRFIYRVLELDPFQPQALLVLSDFFRGKRTDARPIGDEIYSGIIIEYAMDRKSTITPDQKRSFDKARIEIMKQWGFVTARGGETDIDHLGYMGYINELMGKVRSVTNGFKMALSILGVQVGVLDPSNGLPTREYRLWLKSPAILFHT
jgi:hypothetical protein